MKCEKEYCKFCDKEVECQWFHKYKVHNMPINWQGKERAEFEIKKHNL